MNTAMLLAAGNWAEILGLASKGFVFISLKNMSESRNTIRNLSKHHLLVY